MMTKSKHPIQVTGLILAGGKARRMGGQDKGLLLLAGTSLVGHCVAALASQVQQIFISANRHIDEYAQFSYPVLQDSTDNYDGPLAGLQRALEKSPEQPVFVIPCDAPLLSDLLCKKLLKRLMNTYNHENCLAVIPHDGTRLQPLFGLYSPSTLQSLSDYLASGQRKVDTWAISLVHKTIDCSDMADAFMNINVVDDLQRAESLITSAER